MNLDLDDRIIPNGEYREALNVQVSTSEDSDVGSVQNILGNTRRDKIRTRPDAPPLIVPFGTNFICV